jgi:hypothetical protein
MRSLNCFRSESREDVVQQVNDDERDAAAPGAAPLH